MTEPVLELDRVSISYFTRAGEVPAVVDVSLTLAAGESVGLVGESGCGKSTLALAIMQHFGGNGRLTGGRIRFRGRDLADFSPDELRRMRGAQIGMIYQEAASALNPSLTIGEQLAEVPVFHYGLSWADASRRAHEMLTDVQLPDAARIMAAYPHQLSGGQQQRAVIAMALVARPAVLLLDEPTTGLDTTVEAGVVELIASLSRRFGTSLLYISHNLALLLRACDRIAVMYTGEIVEEGTAAAVYANRLHPYTRGLFACLPDAHSDKNMRPLVPIRGTVSSPAARPIGCFFGPRCDAFRPGVCNTERVALLETEPGHGVRCLRWREAAPTLPLPRSAAPPPHDPSVALTVHGLTKDYAIGLGRRRKIRANDALDFSVPSGRTLAIVGESGCGKSTFARLLMGLETATAGSIDIGSRDLAQLPVRRRPASQLRALQMVFQNPDETLNPSFAVGRQVARVVRRFGIERQRARIAARVTAMLDAIKLTPDILPLRPRQLSGGQKQRIAIARAFIGDPQLVVADEPVSALDVSVRAAVVELLMDLQRRHGTTLILISHDLPLVRYIADSVVVMYLGRIMESGDIDEVLAPPFHPYTESLLAAAPIADPADPRRPLVLKGERPSPLDPPAGCPFHSRCPRFLGDICVRERPREQVTASGHRIACHIPMAQLAEAAPLQEVLT